MFFRVVWDSMVVVPEYEKYENEMKRKNESGYSVEVCRIQTNF